MSSHEIGGHVFVCDVYGAIMPGVIISYEEYKEKTHNLNDFSSCIGIHGGACVWYDSNNLAVKFYEDQIAVLPLNEIFSTSNEALVFKLMSM